MKEKYYVTTPIYYPSSDLHIGHTYTTVAADTLKRFKALQGYDAYMITGIDEHGQKIEKVAEEKGMSAQAFVDEEAARIAELWKLMRIDHDQLIRTTDPEHMKTIQRIFKSSMTKAISTKENMRAGTVPRVSPSGQKARSSTENARIAAGQWRWPQRRLTSLKCPNTQTVCLSILKPIRILLNQSLGKMK